MKTSTKELLAKAFEMMQVRRLIGNWRFRDFPVAVKVGNNNRASVLFYADPSLTFDSLEEALKAILSYFANNKIEFRRVKDLEAYVSEELSLIARETGEHIHDDGDKLIFVEQWVLRNADGRFIDVDSYLNDLTDRNHIRLKKY